MSENGVLTIAILSGGTLFVVSLNQLVSLGHVPLDCVHFAHAPAVGPGVHVVIDRALGSIVFLAQLFVCECVDCTTKTDLRWWW